MSAITLKGNGRFGTLNASTEFVGTWESVENWSKYKISIWNSASVEVIVEQSLDGMNVDKRSTHQVLPILNDPEVDNSYESNSLLGQIYHPFLRILVNNLSAIQVEECRIWVQAYEIGHLVAQTDSITMFGTYAGTPTPIAVDADGNLAVEVKVEGITLTPQTDGISIFGTNGTEPVQLKTSLIVGEEGSLQTTNTDISKLELHANKPITLHTTDPQFIANAGDFLSRVIDLGEGVNRDRNVVFYGTAFTNEAPFNDPKIIMKFTDSLTSAPFVSDGVFANFYKKPNGVWEFVFQRSNCPLRYVQLYADTPTVLTYIKAITSKD